LRDERVASGGVGADDEDAAQVLYFADGIGHDTTAESGGQTSHRRRMSEQVTAVDIVGADHSTCELLD
jgi:hypothetical protein